jgi:hypothetical protein
MLNNQVFLTDDHFFNVFKGMEGITVVDKPKSLSLNNDLSVGFIPYIPVGRLSELNLPKHKVVFGHQEIKNAKFGHVISEKGDDWNDNNPLLISGHIHEYQRLANVIYVGTPYQTNFAETPDKSISLITVSGEKIEEKRVYLNIPKKQLLETDVEGFLSFDFNEKDDYKVIINGTTEELSALKKNKKFKQINEKAKLLLKPTDKSIVKKNVANLNFYDLLQKEVVKESQVVQQIFEEVINEASVSKL